MSQTAINQDTRENLQQINLENEFVRCVFLPEVGGKMISLYGKETGFEHLSCSGRSFRLPKYDDSYGNYDISGFDECLPAIARGFYPEWPWEGTLIPDHGELWTLPWQADIEADVLHLRVGGVRFPYRFSKTVRLQDHTVRIDYRLENLSPFNFKYIWAAHPLFNVTEGMRLYLPGNPRIRTDYSKHDRFGKVLYETHWPHAQQTDGVVADLSVIRSARADAATKFFTTSLARGDCALQDPVTGIFLRMTWPHETIPYLGVWINEGGWPFTGNPSFNVALEPATGCPDKLDIAVQREEYALLRPHQQTSWHLCFIIGRSPTPLNLRQ
jgi:galactose mutarotase-like enzyme